jgi:tRNA 2-thiocytidine biosynthesis protein TtcA
MIDEGDRILIAVSGGIDSTSLAHILWEKSKKIPFQFELEACHVVTDIAPRIAENEARLDDFFSKMGMVLRRESIPVMDRLDPGREMNCFFCAMQRRTRLLALANQHGFTKIAYGHHMDDIIETLLMNMLYKAEISTMPARLELDDHDVVFIRPLSKVSKGEIKLYAADVGIEDLEQSCTYGANSRRERVRAIIEDLASDDERIRNNLSAALGRVKNDYLLEKLRGE